MIMQLLQEAVVLISASHSMLATLSKYSTEIRVVGGMEKSMVLEDGFLLIMW